ncbi:MAG: single-stranded DNA-binding protein [bacterium]
MINEARLLGHVGQEPETKETAGGVKFARFSLATSERWKDRETNERRERTQWHQIVVFNENLVGVVEQYVKKGSKLYIEGQIMSRSWEDEAGQKRYATDIVLKGFRGRIVLLDRREGKPDPDPEAYGQGDSWETDQYAYGGAA